MHYKNLPMQYTKKKIAVKLKFFQLKVFDILLILTEKKKKILGTR